MSLVDPTNFYLTHKCTEVCKPIQCPCAEGDKKGHLFPDDHRELAEVGMFCITCDDWCERYKTPGTRAASQ